MNRAAQRVCGSRAAMVLAAALVCQRALAEGKGKEDEKGAVAVIAALLVLTPVLQFLIATLLPAFTRRVQRALRAGFWPSTGWGALAVVLGFTVAMILAKGGRAGEGVAAAIGVACLALAIGGGVGISKSIGDWALARWDLQPMGPFSVLAGSVVWAWGAAIPIVGWLAGLLSLFASLGAAVQVILHPRALDGPPPGADHQPATGRAACPTDGEANDVGQDCPTH